MNANTIPLQEVIPWSPSDPRTILVCDSIETDGSFVLSTMAAQLFSSTMSPSSSIMQAKGLNRQPASMPSAFWLSGNASTEKQVAATLKKLGCDAGASYLRKNNNPIENSINSRTGLKIRGLASEMSDLILMSTSQGGDEDGSPFHNEQYLKTVYRDLKAWVNSKNEEPTESTISWIFLDDVTALASILGDRLVFCFVESLIALVNRPESSCGLIIRCSGDSDQMLHKIEGNEKKDQTGWFGAGGLSHKQATHDTLFRSFVPWERSMEESVDAIIDVLPLLSGFSREAHGRLIFSETANGRGWKTSQNRNSRGSASGAPLSKSSSRANASNSSNWNKLIFNYRMQDNGARAIRLRAR